MSYIHKPLKQPLEHRLPFQLLRAHVAAHPNKEAFVFRDVKKNRLPITFQEYETVSQSLAEGLLQIGLKRGDRVLMMVGSCPEFLYIHIALNRIGAVAILSEENDLGDLKDIKDPACIIAKSDFSSSGGQQTLKEIHARLAGQPNAKAVLIGCEGDHSQHIYTYNDLFVLAKKTSDNSQRRREEAEKQVLMDDPSIILFTSGSTGRPKPIEYTNHALVNIVLPWMFSRTISADSRHFNDCPFSWLPSIANGIILVLIHGCTTIFFPPKIGLKGGFTRPILEIIAEEKCTEVLLLPFFLHDLINQGIPDDIDLSSVKTCETGGQIISATFAKQILDILPSSGNLLVVYASTETGVIASQMINRENLDEVIGSMEILDGFEVKVIDENGQVVPTGEKGELYVRSPWVAFPNYDMQLSSQNKTKPQTNNWHSLRDLCSITQTGQLKIYGRMDHLIKYATESIRPIEVEEVLCKHPDVDKVCICGVPDQRFYNKICACIVLKKGKKGDQAAFQKWSEENFQEMESGLSLAPHYYVFVDSFPLTKNGKLCRKQTKELAVKMLGLE